MNTIMIKVTIPCDDIGYVFQEFLFTNFDSLYTKA